MKLRVIFLSLLCVALLAGCSSGAETPDEIIKELNKLLEARYFLPEAGDYEISYAFASRLPEEINPSGRYSEAGVSYVVEKGDKAKDYEQKNTTIVYGPYWGKVAFVVNFGPRWGSGEGTFEGGLSRGIAGHQVYYEKVERAEISTLLVGFAVEGDGYILQFHLNNISEEEAWLIVESLIERTQQ